MFFMLLISILPNSCTGFSPRSTSELKHAINSCNPFLDQDGLPRFEAMRAPETITKYLDAAVTTALDEMDTKFSELESRIRAKEVVSGPVIMDELERVSATLSYAWGVAGHLNTVKNSDELRKVYEQLQPKVVQALNRVAQSKTIFEALDAVDLSTLDQANRRAVENALRNMGLAGVGISDPAKKKRFNEIKMRLAELSTSFNNNVLDSTKAFKHRVTTPSSMVGVPEGTRAQWAANAGGDKDLGPWDVTLDGPSYMACLKHCPDRDVRETVYKAYMTRASTDKLDNTNLITEILSLRKEMSGILGFQHYADQSLSSKMANSVAEVTQLSRMLADKAIPHAITELSEVTALALGSPEHAHHYRGVDKLAHWDVAYWSERLQEQKFDLKEEELRPYFPLNNVLDGLFKLVARLFDIDVQAATSATTEVWHDDVQFYHIKSRSTGQHLASFYLDPYSRPGEKNGGAWMNECVGKSKALGKDIPVAYVICNGSPPVDGKPSLMTFREAETLFHEFGHGLQHMLTTVDVGSVSGISGVEWDAVELPSQFMENWCYDDKTLFGMAAHYETGETLPRHYYDKLLKQRTYGAGMFTTRQLLFGQLDMTLHTTFDPQGEQSLWDVHRAVAQEYSPHMIPLPTDRFLCAFSHIFGGGYQAGYYSYKWAEVLSADAFGAFEEVGLDQEKAVTALGRRFRDTVLSLGGSEPPSEVYSRFRGRQANTDALLRHLGLN